MKSKSSASSLLVVSETVGAGFRSIELKNFLCRYRRHQGFERLTYRVNQPGTLSIQNLTQARRIDAVSRSAVKL